MLSHVLGADKRMTLSYGIYKDDWGADDGRFSLSARATRLLIDRAEGAEFLHIGAAYRHSGSDGTVRYTAKPGTNTPDKYLDSGTFEPAGADHYGLELQYTRRGLSVLAELVSAQVRSEPTSNPHFMGFYVIGSWVITGEHRAYDHATGLVRPLVPQGRWGAPELIARYANVDLDGGTIRGGRYQRVEFGINWWATARWKLGIIGGRVWLDRFGETGVTDSLLTRLQWIY